MHPMSQQAVGQEVCNCSSQISKAKHQHPKGSIDPSCPLLHPLPSASERSLRSNTKPWLRPLCANLDSIEVHPERSQEKDNSADFEKKFDYDESPTGHPHTSPRPLNYVKDDCQSSQWPQTLKDSEVSNGSSFENGIKLNPVNLRGGLRCKGYRHPPLCNALLDKQGAEDTEFQQSSCSPEDMTCFVSSTFVQEPHNQKGITKLYKKRSTRTSSVTYIISDDDSSANELSSANGGCRKKEPCNQKWGSEIKVSTSSSFGYFDSDDSEAEEDVPRQISTSMAHLMAKFSRITRSFLQILLEKLKLRNNNFSRSIRVEIVGAAYREKKKGGNVGARSVNFYINPYQRQLLVGCQFI